MPIWPKACQAYLVAMDQNLSVQPLQQVLPIRLTPLQRFEPPWDCDVHVVIEPFDCQIISNNNYLEQNNSIKVAVIIEVL